MCEIEKLIDRLLSANGESRDNDLSIMRFVENIGGDRANALHYTTSVDDAMTLLPPEHGLRLDWMKYEGGPILYEAAVEEISTTKQSGHAEAYSYPLAICVAAIRSRLK